MIYFVKPQNRASSRRAGAEWKVVQRRTGVTEIGLPLRFHSHSLQCWSLTALAVTLFVSRSQSLPIINKLKTGSFQSHPQTTGKDNAWKDEKCRVPSLKCCGYVNSIHVFLANWTITCRYKFRTVFQSFIPKICARC